jgi:hypothetical protein
VAERARERERQAKLAETDLRHQLARIEEARRAVIAETRVSGAWSCPGAAKSAWPVQLK